MDEELRFGSFSIHPGRRSLLRDGVAVPLGSRAIDILLFLAAHPGEVKSNQEIVDRVWPSTFVQEANLRVHISALRKALGDTRGEPRFIANVPGRGYAFVAAVERVAAFARMPAGRPPQDAADRLRILGRDQNIAAIIAQLSKGRLVTITGPGGIGKTTVARAVLAALAPAPGAVSIDLSEVGDADLVQTLFASALGLPSRSADAIAEMARALDARQALVVLDSCEHVVEAVALLVEAILDLTQSVCFLATSREPLRVTGERVHRLKPLDLPLSGVSAEVAARSPAVQLFVERADACLGGYELSDADAPAVAEICTRLDGIALAIELAAGRLESMGVAALAGSLADGFKLLTRGRRTALPRHQTLRATLDWSYHLLTRAEQQALAEISVFRGRFTLDGAEAVVSGDGAEAMAGLVAKSLVLAEPASAGESYRLLDTTRIYAAEKLAESGAEDAARARTLAYMCSLLEASGTVVQAGSADEIAGRFGYLLPSLRVGLDWAFGDGGDRLLGTRATVASLPLFFKLSLFDECFAAITTSLTYLDADQGRDEASRMKLYAALGWQRMQTIYSAGHGATASSRAGRIARRIGDVDHQLRALWGLWVDAVNRGEPAHGLELADTFTDLAATSSDPTDTLVGRRMQGATLHWMARHAESRAILAAMLADYEAVASQSHSFRFQFDQRVTAHIVLARCRWFLGEEAEAMREVEDALRYAMEIRNQASVCNLLAEAGCPLALLAEDDARAARYVGMLKEHTKAAALDVWNAYADCFEAELIYRSGDSRGCLRQLHPNMQRLRAAGFVLLESQFTAVEARAMAALGQHEAAIRLLDAALAAATSTQQLWCLPLLQRARGTIAADFADEAAALASFTAAIRAAEEAGAAAFGRRLHEDIRRTGLSARF
ncbi:ATP-binding protein [Marinibaculum pumilum]|uniref:ATP-binding protein n=1 Tax=Marinibaculum pumilum TaxID=1766165 RepID=A0ABV7L8G1_9PROT